MHFQSHFGLILSLTHSAGIRNIKWPFNPILVWFYQGLRLQRYGNLGELSIPFWSDFILAENPNKLLDAIKAFNPILVWFYHTSLNACIGIKRHTCFQSHFGLILSLGSPLYIDHQILPFNPILVWFYLINSSIIQFTILFLSIPFWSDFILSRLLTLGCLFRLSIPFWSDFIRCLQSSASFQSVRFQSHFGLILSFHSMTHDNTVNRLSIPFWSDFIKPHPFHLLYHFCRLSIPFWSDFISPATRSLRRGDTDFQSHFGLILSKERELEQMIREVEALSIPFWSDFIGTSATTISFSNLLSIPFWSDFIDEIASDIESVGNTFNPILVWFYLKTVRGDCGVTNTSSFNPILVWFYPLKVMEYAIKQDFFQSHFGLILSFVPVWNPRPRIVLSIPFWSDFIGDEMGLGKTVQSSFNPILVWFYRLVSGW